MNFNPNFYDADDPAAMFNMLRAGGMAGRPPRRFDEYYRCYPTVMMAGPEREHLNYGGKIMLPPSALDKLSRLHVTYPMMFELTNGQKGKMTHAGVLEFVAEEGKVYMPNWMMKTLQLEIGDLVQIKSTDLPSGTFVKIEPQSTNFLDISDPKAVLEQAFRNFSCLTKGDIFSFHYNDTVYDVAVLEVKPESSKMGISVVEVDLSVDFAPPVGYVEPSRSVASGTSTPRSGRGLPAAGGLIHSQSTMAASINYNDIAPSSTTAAAGARAVSSNFLLGGQKLSARKGGKDKAPTPKPSTPVAGASSNSIAHTELSKVPRRTNGPQPLRLQPNQLFFGYEIKSVRTQADRDKENAETVQPRFEGVGQTLRGGVKRKGGEAEEKGEDKGKGKAAEDKAKGTGAEGRRLDGRKI